MDVTFDSMAKVRGRKTRYEQSEKSLRSGASAELVVRGLIIRCFRCPSFCLRCTPFCLGQRTYEQSQESSFLRLE